MWRARVEAHDAPMFTNNSYEISRALVAERQASLRNEVREHRSTRGRRGRKARRLSDLHNPTPTSTAVREHLFT
jgi:hypothetical protein